MSALIAVGIVATLGVGLFAVVALRSRSARQPAPDQHIYGGDAGAPGRVSHDRGGRDDAEPSSGSGSSDAGWDGGGADAGGADGGGGD